MKYSGVNHLALATGNMDETIRFWRDLLGLRLIAGYGKRGYRHYFFALSDYDMIAFFEWPGLTPIEEKEHGRPTTGPFVFDHVAIGVETEDDIWEVKDRLYAADIWVSEVIDHGFIHSIYSFDPNGIAIEFTHYVPGIDLRERPVMADTEPSGVTLEGFDPQPGKWPPVKRPTPKGERRIYPGEGKGHFPGKK